MRGLMRARSVAAVASLALLLTIGSVYAASRDGITVAVSTEASYRAGTTEAKSIQFWLQKNAQYANGQMVGEPAKLGDVTVIYQTSSGSRQSAVGDGPPVPLPASGKPGDKISISSTSGGVTQTWSYSWQGSSSGGQWILTSYTWVKSTNTTPTG